MPSTIFCIDGLIGAGKSSLMQQLTPYYHCFPEPLETWTLLTPFYQNPTEHGYAFQVQVSLSQYIQKLAFSSQHITLVERCPWTSRYIFAPLILDSDTLHAYDQLYKQLGYKVDYFIYLEIDPALAFQRIQKRFKEYDEYISLDYLVRLHRQYTTQLKPNLNVFTVDAERPLDQVVSDVLKIIASPNVLKLS